MASKSYTPISGFWFVLIPAVVLGLGYYLWNSHSFLAMRLQSMLRPLADFAARLFSGLF